MKWRTCKLGDVITLKRGHDLPSHSRRDGEIPVVSSSGITGYHDEARADAPGVITGRYGTIGEVFYLEEPYWPLNTALYVIDFRGNHPKFAAYLLKHTLKDYQSDKAAVPGVDRNVLHEFDVRIPDLAAQSRIASLLTAYDDLIENNRRRMALLEESARLLYREWFVHLRFPGHESTRFVDGLPVGWRMGELEEVCAKGNGIQTGPFGSQLHQSDYSEDGVPVVMPKDLIGFRIATDGIARIPEQLAERLSRHRMEEGDTVYGRRGDIGRRAYVGARQTGWLCGTGSLRIRPDPEAISPMFLFETLGTPATAGIIANRAKGATMLNLNTKILRSVPILLPKRSVQEGYVTVAEPLADAIEVLSEQNQKLKTARDLLLPKLMSGELAV